MSARASIGVALAAALAGGAPAQAELSRAALAQVGVHAPADAHEPLGMAFRDRQWAATTLGRAMAGAPAVLVFEDFRCRTLCGPALSIVATGIRTSGLQPGRDVRLVSIGLNPRETPDDAARFAAGRLADDPALLASARFLTGTASTIAAASAAVGYGYAYDPATDQFTHPVAAFVLSPDGRLMRVLPETALTGADLKTAVAGADRGQVGDLVDRLALFCHDLVPLSGRYDGAVQAALKVGGVATLIAMAAAGVALMRRRRTA